ncbi:hypothetical protein BVRB_021960, partial [Beta vulgaris subsp. vulgaris]
PFGLGMPPATMLDTGLPIINGSQARSAFSKKQATQRGEKSPERKRTTNRVSNKTKPTQRVSSPRKTFSSKKSTKLSEEEILKQQLEELKSGQKPKDKQVMEILMRLYRLAHKSNQIFCQELLLAGFVNSYVEFFHLTHRTDDQSKSPMTIEELEFVKKCLSDSETAHRQSELLQMMTF